MSLGPLSAVGKASRRRLGAALGILAVVGITCSLVAGLNGIKTVGGTSTLGESGGGMWIAGVEYNVSHAEVQFPNSCTANGPESNTTFDGADFSVYYSDNGCGPGGSLLGGSVRDPSGAVFFFNLSDRQAPPEWFTPTRDAGVLWGGGSNVTLLVRTR